MREILFRGKTDKGEWVYGSLQCFKGFSIFDNDLKNFVAVKSNTIGQYTGLTDKNGKKIFEEDIVRYDNTINEVVFEQRNGTAYFGVVIDDTETWGFCYLTDAKTMEVIGNIHDNPELMKGGGSDA